MAAMGAAASIGGDASATPSVAVISSATSRLAVSSSAGGGVAEDRGVERTTVVALVTVANEGADRASAANSEGTAEANAAASSVARGSLSSTAATERSMAVG